MSKLTTQQVLEIRSKRAAGFSQPDLAIEYNVSVNTIRSIEKGHSHRQAGGFELPPDAEFIASQDRLAKLIEQEGLAPVEAEPDPLKQMLANAVPLSVSMSRIRENEEKEQAERMQGLKELKNSDSDSQSTGDSHSERTDT